MLSSDPIKFGGSRSFLSNMYKCRLSVYGRTFRSVEHAYQYRKAMFNEDLECAECIRRARSPYLAKRLSYGIRKKRRGTDWNAVRVACMKGLLMSKFGGSDKLKADLLATGDAELVEWVPSREGFWGTRIGDVPGENKLGKLLMGVRDAYKDA